MFVVLSRQGGDVSGDTTQALRVAFCWLFLVVFQGVATPAFAHPFDDGLAGHRFRLTVLADHLELELLVEEPVPWVLRDLRTFLAGVEHPGPADQERYDARRLDEFESGLQLYVGGQRVQWERRPWQGENGVGDRQFVLYGLHLHAPIDPSQEDVTINLIDTIHPGEKVARMVEVWGSWDTDLRGCSLWADPERNQSGKWTIGSETTELRLTRRLPSIWARGEAWLGMSWRTGTLEPVPVGPGGIAGPVDRRVVALVGALLMLVLLGAVRLRKTVRNGGRYL